MSVVTASSHLSEDEKRKYLAGYDNLKDKEQQSTTAAKDYYAEAKNSLIFQYNWEELLGATPMAINLIGSCYIASSTPVGISVTLTPPQGGFKYLR